MATRGGDAERRVKANTRRMDAAIANAEKPGNAEHVPG